MRASYVRFTLSSEQSRSTI